MIALRVPDAFLQSRFALARLFQDDPGGGCDPGGRASRPDLARPGGAGTGVSGRVPGPEAMGRRELDRRSGLPGRARSDDPRPSTRRRIGRRSTASRAGSTEVGSRSIIIPTTVSLFIVHHLDAMWASLATGVPTINGYSGHAPVPGNGFFRPTSIPKTGHEEPSWPSGSERTHCRPIKFSGSAPNDRFTHLARSETRPKPLCSVAFAATRPVT